ncbi:hypothetical protein COLO4_16554 [Corchorus olitorius]|uniref:Transcription repressor n=1 Tax=Corchorus olitorius TaxID=93759 RepID=A0A1R3JGS3_9ROSI|nr:hypothetical protein COLO4_16554 [Corchorus olitorius]
MGRATTRNTNSSSKKKPGSGSGSSTTQSSKLKQPHYSYPRKSYYFTRQLTPNDRFYVSPTKTKSKDDPPRKSSKRTRKRNVKSSPKVVTSSVSAGCSCRATLWTKADSPPEYSASNSSSSSSVSDSSSDQKLISESFPHEFRSDCILKTDSFDNMVSWSRRCSCQVINSDINNDIVIDVDDKSIVKKFDKFPELEVELPPIITKPPKFNDMVKEIKKKDQKNDDSTKYRRCSTKFEEKNSHGSLSVKVVKEERITVKENKNITSPVVRKFSVNSPGGVRLRINSPKIANRKIQSHGRKSVSSSSSSSSRKSLSESFAVVKSSFDPQKDFRESMVEMIMENNIRASKDLEDLLACYLSLNSDEYHDLIIKVFKQIWFDLSDVQLK